MNLIQTSNYLFFDRSRNWYEKRARTSARCLRWYSTTRRACWVLRTTKPNMRGSKSGWHWTRLSAAKAGALRRWVSCTNIFKHKFHGVISRASKEKKIPMDDCTLQTRKGRLLCIYGFYKHEVRVYMWLQVQRERDNWLRASLHLLLWNFNDRSVRAPLWLLW